MLNKIKNETIDHMEKSFHYLETELNKIRTGRAHPSILDSVTIEYYGNIAPINQAANIIAEDNRTLVVTPWEGNLLPLIEKAILKANLGFSVSTNGNSIRLPMPGMTEETRKQYIKQAYSEAEKAKISIRNIRRNANNSIKKIDEMNKDQIHEANAEIQTITDQYILKIDQTLKAKEDNLMQI